MNWRKSDGHVGHEAAHYKMQSVTHTCSEIIYDLVEACKINFDVIKLKKKNKEGVSKNSKLKRNWIYLVLYCGYSMKLKELEKTDLR